MSETNTVNLDEIKLYLRVDGEEEDVLLQNLFEFSKEHIEGATGAKYETYKGNATYKLLQKIIISDRYENRSSEDFSGKFNLNPLFIKLKYKVMIDEEESSESTE